MRIAPILAGSLFLTLAACHEHVTLNAPPPNAPIQDRAVSYNQIRPLSYHQTETISTQGSFRSTDYVQLANGSRIYYPEDLLPVIQPDSPTAQAVDANVSKRNTAQALGLGAVGAFIGGMALAFVPLIASDGETTGTVLPGLGIAIFGGIGLGIASKFVRASAEDEAATAYETYDDSLRKRLNLCMKGEQVVDCTR